MRVLVMTLDASGEEQYQLGDHVGREPYPGAGNTGMTRGVPDYQSWGRRGAKVPKIVLDSGMTIWGPECWWQPVEISGGGEVDATV